MIGDYTIINIPVQMRAVVFINGPSPASALHFYVEKNAAHLTLSTSTYPRNVRIVPGIVFY